MFALTYGTGVDWYKNVLVSGRAKITFKGREHQLIDPAAIPTAEGQSAFGFPKGNILRIIGIKDFFFIGSPPHKPGFSEIFNLPAYHQFIATASIPQKVCSYLLLCRSELRYG